jgi:hypothetical protein
MVRVRLLLRHGTTHGGHRSNARWASSSPDGMRLPRRPSAMVARLTAGAFPEGVTRPPSPSTAAARRASSPNAGAAAWWWGWQRPGGGPDDTKSQFFCFLRKCLSCVLIWRTAKQDLLPWTRGARLLTFVCHSAVRNTKQRLSFACHDIRRMAKQDLLP